MVKKPEKKSKWKTVRAVVEYRTTSDMSERNFTRIVQNMLDTATHYEDLKDSKVWAKGFQQPLGKMQAARPRRLQAAIKKLDAAKAQLRGV